MKDKNKKRVLDMIVSRLDELGVTASQILPEEIMEEYAQGSDTALNQLAMASAGVSSLNAQFANRMHIEAVQGLLADTGDDLQSSIRTAQMMGISAVDKITNNVTDQMAEGLAKGTARKVATNELKQYLADSGFTGFITSDNRRLPLDFYAKTVMRTKRKEANVKGMINRYTENGVQFVRINSHAPTCEHCARFHRVIVQIQGEPVAGVTQLKDTQLPPYHPNCRCAITPVQTLEGEEIINPRTKDPRTPTQKRAYDSEQKIRRKANEEKKLYNKMKASGVEVPKTIGAFRRLKRRNDPEWQKLQDKYKKNINYAVQYTAKKNSRNPARMTANEEILSQFRQNNRESGMESIKDNVEIKKKLTELGERRIFTSYKEVTRKGKSALKVTLHGETFGVAVNDQNKAHLDALETLTSKADVQTYGRENYHTMESDMKTVLQNLMLKYESLEQTFKADGYETALGAKYARKLGRRSTIVEGDEMQSWEEDAFHKYTTSAYKELNQQLREGWKWEDIPRNDQITHERLQDILSRSRVTEDIYVQRGADARAIGGSQVSDQILDDPTTAIGMEFTDKGYMSTSINAESKFSAPMEFHIKVPEGSNALYISDFSAFANEHEVLLPPNTTLRVEDVKIVEQTGEDQIRLFLEVVEK